MTHTHECSATVFDTSPAGTAANAYTEHHQTCHTCARYQGLEAGKHCTSEQWFHLDEATTCTKGWALFRAWQRVANRTPPQETVLHRGAAK